MSRDDPTDRIVGVLLGTAVGDAIGLPREMLSPRRAEKMFGARPLRHRLLLGKGMISDDTEHACMTANAWLATSDPESFVCSLGWRLRWWLAGLPAGIGLATAKGIFKLWLGFPPDRSGVFSAGNGPAMRSAILGLVIGDDLSQLHAYVRASTRLTHTDPQAEAGALAIALAAHYASKRTVDQIDPAELEALLKQHIEDETTLTALAITFDALRDNLTAEEFATRLGRPSGISGYILHTVPAVLFCWLKHRTDFRAAVEAVICLGGDSDTTGAICGALAGATLGASAIPSEWLANLMEWPRSVAWMHNLARQLVYKLEDKPCQPPRLFWPGFVIRNPLFLLIVLGHGVRRLLPPY